MSKAEASAVQSLERQFANMKETKCLVLLDPCYKSNVLSVDTLSKAKTWLQEEHTIMSKQKGATSGDEGSEPKRTTVEEKV